MFEARDECRWCGSPHVYELGLCYACYTERDAEELFLVGVGREN